MKVLRKNIHRQIFYLITFHKYLYTGLTLTLLSPDECSDYMTANRSFWFCQLKLPVYTETWLSEAQVLRYSHAYLLFWKHNLKMRLYADRFVHNSPLVYLIMVSKRGGIFLEAIRICLWFIDFRIFPDMYWLLKGHFRVFSSFCLSFLLLVVTMTGATRASTFSTHCVHIAMQELYAHFLIWSMA